MRSLGKTDIGNLKPETNKRKASKLNVPASTSSTASCACGGVCPSCKSKLAGLKVSTPNSALENEADQLAKRALSHETKSGSIASNQSDAAQPSESGDSTIGLTGQPLSASQRQRFETGLGADLSQVRVHTGAGAQALASPLQAEAFTLGRNIVIGDPGFRAESAEGQNLLAHELAHTVQQGAATRVPGSPAAAVGHSGPMIMRRLLRTATINFLCGSSNAFLRSPPSGTMHLNAGETSITITSSINWDRPAICGKESEFFITLKRSRSILWDADHGTNTFPVGTSSTQTFTGLEADANYYLEIRSNNTNPNCCLTGSLDINTP